MTEIDRNQECPLGERVLLGLRLGGQGELDQVLGIKAGHLCHSGENEGRLELEPLRQKQRIPEGAETTPEGHTAVPDGYYDPDLNQPTRCLLSTLHPACSLPSSLENHPPLLPPPSPVFISALTSTNISQQVAVWVVSCVWGSSECWTHSPAGMREHSGRRHMSFWVLPPLLLYQLALELGLTSLCGALEPIVFITSWNSATDGERVCGGVYQLPTAPSLPSLHLIPEDEKLTVASAGDSWCQDLPRPSGAGSLETLHPFRLL